MGHGTLLNQSMNAKTIVRDMTNPLDSRGTPRQVNRRRRGILGSVSLSLSFSTVNLRLCVVWGTPENMSWADFTSKRPIKQLYQATSLGLVLVFSEKQLFRIALRCIRCLSRLESKLIHFFFMWNLSILCLLIVCKYHIRSPEAKL